MRIAPALAFAALASAALAQTPGSDPDARRLFLAHCAPCHGETGDGQGTSQLDRPARSFQDGGFSFGNTPEALFRTISTGIPGTPMPGFDSALSVEERELVAGYVVTLGPPIEEVKDEEMIAVVRDECLIVRGLLPALAEGLPDHPRGLLIGDPSGITFEYRVDDVRLLALRQGGFVRKTDWTGRGGTALEPLGKVVHLVEAGEAGPSFSLDGRSLVARLSGTRAQGRAARLEYHLVDGGREFAHVWEQPRVLTTGFGTGFGREFWLTAGSADTRLVVSTPAFDGAEVLAGGAGPHQRWQVVRPPQGPPVWVAVGGSRLARVDDVPARSNMRATIALPARESESSAYVRVLVLTEWNEVVEQQLGRWMKETP